MSEDPIKAFDRYKHLFMAHVIDMEQNETGHTPTLSRAEIRFVGRADVEEGFPYTELIYGIDFNSDTRFHAKTILAIEKWVDVSSCRLVSHDPATETYHFEIKLLQRNPE
ncbi:hypothetical protein [Desulfoluna spongiiphila]|uniref:hypothetical protein n=1 Tax=Desulfoluna spongiiphila TaxID=419481 RepID=UPI0012512785|nr:hypothetical protein [Desulfoluna spongiiphila]VVS91988.1 hypothetical protein DBB_15560 [Desulfoluna spongiiphila]